MTIGEKEFHPIKRGYARLEQKQIKENRFPPEFILSVAEWAGMTKKKE